VRKRTVTTIEMHQILVVRRPAGAAHALCPACLKEVEMVPLEEAVLLAGVSLRDICRRVGAEDIHLVETTNGALICLNSLLNKVSLGDGRLNSDGADIPSSASSDLSDAAKPPSSLPYE
jgi:hypothetical protein